ncbi:ATP-binding cassette domain-containing protein [Nonomuraea insulae]|uniref:ATP-binding cassette domain-containing protein n=1 Tax=Nonomuraea insulae TaxID=1616787 RepID=A0ABW1D8C1_9ACTN
MTSPNADATGPADDAVDVLRVEHVSKRFGTVTALRDVDIRLAKGEVLGLIGDNGAGKSTLMKIICGFHQPDTGRILLDGEQVSLKSVDHARSLGIDTVYQDLALINERPADRCRLLVGVVHGADRDLPAPLRGYRMCQLLALLDASNWRYLKSATGAA